MTRSGSRVLWWCSSVSQEPDEPAHFTHPESPILRSNPRRIPYPSRAPDIHVRNTSSSVEQGRRETKVMTQDADGERLKGGSQTEVRRLRDVVIRQRGPQSQTVIRLLGHLRDRGFEAAPRPVDDGFTTEGDEQLTYIEGSSPQPLAWNDEAAWYIGRLVRELHNATSDFDSGSAPAWRPGSHAPCPEAVR